MLTRPGPAQPARPGPKSNQCLSTYLHIIPYLDQVTVQIRELFLQNMTLHRLKPAILPHFLYLRTSFTLAFRGMLKTRCRITGESQHNMACATLRPIINIYDLFHSSMIYNMTLIKVGLVCDDHEKFKIITSRKEQCYKLELLYLLNRHVQLMFISTEIYLTMTLSTMHCGNETPNWLVLM